MIERLPVSKKLELLVLIPMLAFSLVLAQFSYVKYQDFQALRLLQQQYTLFQTFDSVNKSLEALRLHISLGEFHNVDDDKIQLQAIVAHLESTSSWLNKTGTQQYFTSLIGDLNFILETDTNELLPSEWGEIIKEAISSIYQLSVKIPVSVRHETLRSDNEKYLLLQKLQNNVADELNYFVLLLANNIELNKQDLDTFSFQQQNIIDVYLNRYASENEIQKLLEAFNHQSFENVVQLRLDIVERHSKGALALSNKEINIIDQRSKRIYAVIISVRKTILSEIEKDIAASVQLIFLNAFLLLAVIVLVLHFSLKIRQRIIGSLAFIGATLQKIERSKDYTIDITIEGADEFSQLSSTLGVLIQQRAVSEFDMIAAKNSAEQANSAKSVFLANMSHEIRTPLNGILGMSDILQKTDMSLSQKSHLKTIQSSSKSLLSLINDILDFSKIESNSLNITKSESNLYFVLDNVVSIIAPKLQSGNVELTLDYPLNVNTVFLMDDYRVQQIILNLVSNAVKFSPEGHVCITVALEKVKDGRRDYNELSVSIRDTGIGMSKEQLSAVFEPFKQVDDSITRKYQGTGLGLTISNHLTQLMGGRLEAKSALGEGSTFTLLLPVEIIADNYLSEEDTSVKDAGLSRLKNKPEYWLQGINVVLLSDDATKQLQTQTYLQEVGASLLDLDHNKTADLAIIELNTPYTDDQLKALFKALSLPEHLKLLVLYSAHTAMDEMILAEQGIEFYGQLPIMGEKLASFIIDAYMDEKENPDTANNNLAGLKVLVVEDDETNQMVAELCLEDKDIVVTLADDGLDGYEKFKEGDFDLILMDCMMPVMDGIQSTEHIRAFEKEKGLVHIPIIALTASVLNDDIENCFRAGMDAYVHKPFEVNNLLKQIERAVEEFPVR